MTISRISVSPLELFVVDAAPLYDANLDAAGVYVGVAPFDGAAPFRGALVWLSLDGGTTYKPVARVEKASVLGVLTADLNPPVFVEVPDRANTASIFIRNGAAYSKSSYEDLFSGESLAYCDGEIFSYQTATNSAENTYDLTVLLRGRAGTEDAAATTHAANQEVVLFDTDTLTFIELPGSAIAHDIKLKATALGAGLDDAIEVTHTFNGENTRPLAPMRVQGSRDGSNNLSITWYRRSRNEHQGISPTEAPLGEKERSYEVEVYTTGGTLLRTLTVPTEVAKYSASQQTSDGATPGDSYNVRVFQVGAWLRSNYDQVTV